jgi:hypothetical protein
MDKMIMEDLVLVKLPMNVIVMKQKIIVRVHLWLENAGVHVLDVPYNRQYGLELFTNS